jgi:hypothetical protein
MRYTYWMFDGMIRSDMIIKNIGNSLAHILPELIGQDISEVFDLTRPLVDFQFTSVTFPPTDGFSHECRDYVHSSYLCFISFADIETNQQHFRACVSQVVGNWWFQRNRRHRLRGQQ